LARAHVARLLAQQAPLILADEPAAALDPPQAHRVMQAIANHAKAGGAACVVMHDISLAGRYATRVLVLAGGRLLADGAPAHVLTGETLTQAFGAPARLLQDGDAISVAFDAP
jgi:iron complex transport system ATP-binding protein